MALTVLPGLVGLTNVINSPMRYATWKIWNTDTWAFIESGYEPMGEIVETLGSLYVEQGGVGMDAPIQQWVGGRQKIITVDLFFFAEFVFSDIQDRIEKLKKWAQRDPQLKPPRPPRLLFDYGEAFLIPCKLDAIGALRWDARLRGDGTPRVARVSVTLRRWEDEIQYEHTDPNAVERSTIYHDTAKGQTFEHIAAKRYGTENAILGVLLRQDNPDLVPLRIGNEVPVPELDQMTPRQVEGQFPLFAGTEAAEAVLQDHWDLRSAEGTATVPGEGFVDDGEVYSPLIFDLEA